MSGEAERLAKQVAREADLVAVRIKEQRESPTQGRFDLPHLTAIHAYLFQDLPHHSPGLVRSDTSDRWIKRRALEGQTAVYDVPYAHEAVEAQMSKTLRDFGGSATLKGLEKGGAARRMAHLYGDLDYAHGFYEGNSRTLREFTRSLAADAGYTLDWVGTGVTAKQRNQLYIARDVAVLERAFPNLTAERALTTTDRAEYEASFILQGLREAMGARSLETIIDDGMKQQRGLWPQRLASIKRAGSYHQREGRQKDDKEHER